MFNRNCIITDAPARCHQLCVEFSRNRGVRHRRCVEFLITIWQKAEKRTKKMVCVDPHDIPVVAFVDPDMMSTMPKGLTAFTGMDALTHAIEGYITKGACEITDMFHIKAIALIAKSLRDAVANKPEGREGMALAQYIAGMGFSNVGLGVDHSMAHGLSALYDMPHGMACAILLPTVMQYNAKATGTKYRDIAIAMGVKGVDKMTQAQYRKAACDAVQQLSIDVGIPANLKGVLKKEDIDFLADSAVADACCPGNPREVTKADVVKLYKSLMKQFLYNNKCMRLKQELCGLYIHLCLTFSCLSFYFNIRRFLYVFYFPYLSKTTGIHNPA